MAAAGGEESVASAPKYLQKKGAKQFANPLELETNDAAQPDNFFTPKEKNFDDTPTSPPAEDFDMDSLKTVALAARKQAEDEELASASARARIFACICFLEVMVNFDAGVLPVTISHVMTEFKLSFSMAGMLGALVYLGLVVCSPIAGYLLTNLPSQQMLLVVACAANSLAVLSFALGPTKFWLCVGRALIGFTQAPIIIYMPVWVDEFAPPADATMWMSLLQASVAIGIMMGYVCAGLVVTYVGEETCHDGISDPTHAGHYGCYSPNWRVGIYVQSVGMMLFAPFFYLVNGRHINSHGGPEGRVMHAAQEGLARQLMLQSLQGPGLRANHTTQRQIRRQVAQQVQQQVALHNLDGETSLDKGVVAPPWGDEWSARKTATSEGQASWKARLAKVSDSHDHEMPEHHRNVIEQGTHALFDHIKTTVGMVGLFENKHEAGRHQADLDNKVEMSLGVQLNLMLSNKVFVFLTLALSGLYFVVTGLQFWVTDYMTTPVEEGGIGIDAGLVVISFALSSLTGPTAGVFFGGWYIDKHGGYKDDTGEAAAGTLKRCTCFGALALVFAFPAAFLSSFWPIQIAMWFVLFWGGALLSPATGVCINAVSPELRAFSSALSMFSYNILGYAAAPYICGVLAEKFSLRWGFRTVLLSSGVAFVGLFAAWRIADAEYKANMRTDVDVTDDTRSREAHSNNGANADMRGSALETKNPIRQLSDVGRHLSDVGNAISPRVLSRDAKISKSLKQSLTCDSEQERSDGSSTP